MHFLSTSLSSFTIRGTVSGQDHIISRRSIVHYFRVRHICKMYTIGIRTFGIRTFGIRTFGIRTFSFTNQNFSWLP